MNYSRSTDYLAEPLYEELAEQVVTVVVKASNDMAAMEAERSLHDAICVVRNLVSDPRIVYGGGACEVGASLAILRDAETESGPRSLALRAFSDALDSIPLALARNCGLHPVETLSGVKAAQEKAYRAQEAGEEVAVPSHQIGVDCFNTGSSDMKELHVFETLNSKVQQFLLATQMTRMVLKIDEVLEDAV
ncbi:chaperone tailless complex polypeptide 1 [Kipferlia bialata]|uniref:Chaperone tailless complex polypeptide 1 n=1 Tax=Kipferlia bialata TaxID=797122 RepID=A0A391NTP6_9EUKA|nr:chaperone tailless complex polypeptide 1 [Kipferlia bialata]|eukprot:g4681.t1